MKIQWKKFVAHVCLFTLALQSTSTTYPANLKSRTRSAMGAVGAFFTGSLQSVSSTAKKQLRAVSSKIAKFDRAALFSAVSNRLESAGTRIRKISNCISTGQECSSTDRIILIGTATFIFVTLLVLAGSALTVAAKADLIEKAKKEEANKTKGSSAKTLIARLGNTIQSGKARFQSLKSGIISGKLTKSERNFLIGFGVSIIGATIVTAAVLAGLAMYSKKQESRRAIIPPAEDQEELIQTPEVPTTAIPLDQLAQPTPLGDIQAATGPFGKLFDRVVKIKTSGTNILQESVAKVKEKLEEKTRLAQQALKAIGQEKNRLIQKADAAYKEALLQANTLLSKIKTEGATLVKQALNDVFGINYENIQQAFASFNQAFARITPSLSNLSNVPTWGNLNGVAVNWYAIQAKGLALWNNLGSFLTQLTGRKGARASWWSYLGYETPQEESHETRQKLIHDYPLAYKFDALLKIYPQFVQSVKNTNLVSAGNAAEQLLSQVGKTFQDLAQIHFNAGVWGHLLLSPAMVEPINNLGKHMETVGLLLNEFTQGEPLQQLAKQLPANLEVESIREWFTEMTWPPATAVNSVREIFNKLTPQMQAANEQLQHSLTQATRLVDGFTLHSSNLLPFIKQNLIETVSQKPFQNYLNAAKQAVLKEAAISKDLFDSLLLHTAGIVNYLEKLITPLTSTIEKLNSILGREFISQQKLNTLKEVATQFLNMRNELARLRQAAKAILL